ncbi:MAG: hypothetical protein HeimC2_24140 [Candidatus Heimdallarchaeota archaeon LC_2]|nr:MAG: hypothetical protein HeimC2_24140 [Candidatus Heimdallarchaeota archaeon LC_2]
MGDLVSYDPNQQMNTKLHNLFGSGYVDFVYSEKAIQNIERFETVFKEYYRSLGLQSPNRNGLMGFLHGLRFTKSFPFLAFGVRNNYGEIPGITQFYIGILTNPNNYHSPGGNRLIFKAYDELF